MIEAELSHFYGTGGWNGNNYDWAFLKSGVSA